MRLHPMAQAALAAGTLALFGCGSDGGSDNGTTGQDTATMTATATEPESTFDDSTAATTDTANGTSQDTGSGTAQGTATSEDTSPTASASEDDTLPSATDTLEATATASETVTETAETTASDTETGEASGSFDAGNDLCRKECDKWSECGEDFADKFASIDECYVSRCAQTLPEYLGWCDENWEGTYDSLEQCRTESEANFDSTFNEAACADSCAFFVDETYTEALCQADCDSFHDPACAAAVGAFATCWDAITCDQYDAVYGPEGQGDGADAPCLTEGDDVLTTCGQNVKRFMP